MTRIPIGAIDGGSLEIDLMSLIDTRLLVQANSGGGKSGTLRLIAERASTAMQTIILDNEGEFATLREKVDMLLIGDGGELPATTRSAVLLAKRLLETKVSAVIDLYEMPLDQRREFVAEFLTALIALPRALWRPTLIMLDEAHLYAPQGGDEVSTKPVIALQSQGRKRGYCGILATQRLSKLHKDAAAECNNVLIGRTWLDVDQQRAGDVLGMSKSDRAALRDLRTREFFGFGPAFSISGVFRMRTDDVATTMPKAGHRFEVSVPPPSSKVSALLASEFSHIPDEAETEARDLESAQEEIERLRRELAARDVVAPDQDAIDRAVAAAVEPVEQRLIAAGAENQYLRQQIEIALESLTNGQRRTHEDLTVPPRPHLVEPPRVERGAPTPSARSAPRRPDGSGDALGKCERAILTVLDQYRDGCAKGKLTLLSGYRWSGGFRNSLATLRTRGLIEGNNEGTMRITSDGHRAIAGTYEPLPTDPRALQQYWLSDPKLDKAGREVLRTLFAHPNGLNAQEICKLTGYGWTGGLRNSLSALRTAGLIEGKNSDVMRAAAIFFTRRAA